MAQGGALIVNIQAEYNEPEWWNRSPPEGRDALPEPWPEDGALQVTSDGSEHSACFRMRDVNPLNAVYTRQVRLERRISGKLVASDPNASPEQQAAARGEQRSCLPFEAPLMSTSLSLAFSHLFLLHFS